MEKIRNVEEKEKKMKIWIKYERKNEREIYITKPKSHFVLNVLLGMKRNGSNRIENI